MQKSEIFFLDEKKKTRIFSAKIRDFFNEKKKLGFSVQKCEIFFNEKKKTRIFSAKIRDFFNEKKKNSDFQCKNPSVFFKKKILCLSCISHGSFPQLPLQLCWRCWLLITLESILRFRRRSLNGSRLFQIVTMNFEIKRLLLLDVLTDTELKLNSCS